MPHSRVLGLIDLIADPGTFRQWDASDLGVPSGADADYHDDAYLAAVEEARRTTGNDESVVVGKVQVGGHDACLIFGDFDFLAGSVGRVACQLVIAAADRARAAGLPVLASPASGGTRMQEGTPTFFLMADVAAAVARYRSAGLPWVTWLRHPTTGGVMATWGSLGTVTFGEPGALTGFLGPRVFEALNGEEFPTDVQIADNLATRGGIDGLADSTSIRRIFAAMAAATAGEPVSDVVASPTVLPAEFPTGWECVQATRDAGRPTASDVTQAALTDRVTISGTGAGESSAAIAVSIGQWDTRPVVLIAQDRKAQGEGHLLGPTAMRVARRGFAIAAQLQLPVVTIVDTAGAELSVAAEEGALAGEIARCLADMSSINVPTVSLLLGMGCGGGALALLPADFVLSAVHGWVSPLPLEGASIIRYRSTNRAEQMAQEQRISAGEMFNDGIVDVVIPELPNAAAEPEAFCDRVVAAVAASLADLASANTADRLARRNKRYSGGLDVAR